MAPSCARVLPEGAGPVSELNDGESGPALYAAGGRNGPSSDKAWSRFLTNSTSTLTRRSKAGSTSVVRCRRSRARLTRSSRATRARNGMTFLGCGIQHISCSLLPEFSTKSCRQAWVEPPGGTPLLPSVLPGWEDRPSGSGNIGHPVAWMRCAAVKVWSFRFSFAGCPYRRRWFQFGEAAWGHAPSVLAGETDTLLSHLAKIIRFERSRQEVLCGRGEGTRA